MQDESSKQVKEVRSLKEQIETLKRELKDTAEALKTKEGGALIRTLRARRRGVFLCSPASPPLTLLAASFFLVVINFMNRQMAENMQGKRAYAPTSVRSGVWGGSSRGSLLPSPVLPDRPNAPSLFAGAGAPVVHVKHHSRGQGARVQGA